MIKILFANLKTKFDFYLYISSRSRLSSVLVCLELLLFIPSISALVYGIIQLLLYGEINISLVVLFCSAILLLIQYGVKYKHIKKYIFFRVSDVMVREIYSKTIACRPNNIDKTIYSLYKLPIDFKGHVHNHVFMSSSINKLLWSQDNPFILKEDTARQTRVNQYIQDHWPMLFPFLANNYCKAVHENKIFHNEEKLCFADGFDFSAEKSIIVHCTKGNYYNSYLTNGIWGKTLQSTRAGFLHLSATTQNQIQEVFIPQPDASFNLLSFNQSCLSNEIGISTIALTSDNKIFFLVQSALAQMSNHLVAPAGSGSCDYRDIQGTDFKKTIEYAMQRELLEETGCKGTLVNDYGVTRVIGFFRWVERCGKPEFIGITRLNVPSGMMNPNILEAMKDIVLDEIITNIGELESYLHGLDKKIEGFQSQDRYDGFSVPAQVAIIQLKEMCADKDTRASLAQFLNLPNLHDEDT